MLGVPENACQGPQPGASVRARTEVAAEAPGPVGRGTAESPSCLGPGWGTASFPPVGLVTSEEAGLKEHLP